MEGQFESDKQSILQPPAYSPDSVQFSQPPPGDQTVIHVAHLQNPPKDYFAFSILVTIFCCLPFGIVALVKSSEVRTKILLGDAIGAERASAQTKKWSFAALFTGIALISIVFIFYFVIFMIALNASY